MAEASVSSKVANRAGVENCPPSTVVRNGAGVTRVDSPALTDLIETTRTTRHEQGERRPATPSGRGEPVVREKPGVVAAVQRIVGASPDDMWGDRTSEALQRRIMKFQDENGLPVTGRYDRETAKRMRVHSDTETKDLADALGAVRNLDQYYRLAPVHTVTETQERRVPAPGVAVQANAPDNTDEASVGGVCAVPPIAGDAIIPAAPAQPSTATGNGSAVTPTASTVQNLPAEVVESGRVLDAADSLWFSLQSKSTSKGRADSPPQAQPDWMGAAVELGATLKDAGGNIQNVTAQNEFKHGVKENPDNFYTASLGGMMA